MPDHPPVDAVFHALADPTRRAVIDRLASGGPASPTEIAAVMPVSRQAVSKHLSSLDAAGLVHRDRRGREVRYGLNPAPLHEAVAWMARVGGQWDERLDSLQALFGPDS